MIISLQCSVLLGNLCPDIYVDVLWPMQTIRTHLQTKYTPRAYPMPWWQLTLLVFLKEHPHESQDPRLRCQEMISVTHFICQCFKCFWLIGVCLFSSWTKGFFLVSSILYDMNTWQFQSGNAKWRWSLSTGFVCLFFIYDHVISYFVCMCVFVCLSRSL